MSRRKSREAALKLLYSWDIGVKENNSSVDQVIDLLNMSSEEIEYMNELFDRVMKKINYYDRKIQENLNDWKIDRLALIERNILRLAVSELDSDSEVPKKVVINEAVELAKLYCDSKAYRFINGVLDNINMDD